MEGHRWKGDWPWPISAAEAEADYRPGCDCAFCRAVARQSGTAEDDLTDWLRSLREPRT